MKQVSIKVTNGKTLNLELDQSFKGNNSDAEAAVAQLNDFCQSHKVEVRCFRGYGSLTVDGVQHAITPYGVPLAAMLEHCSIELECQSAPQSVESAAPRPRP